MSITTRYLFIVEIDFPAEREAEFNEIYDQEHVPNMLKVPGVVSATRLVRQKLRYLSGGEILEIEEPGEPKFTAIYEIESPEVLTSPEWGTQGAVGRWPTAIRPYFKQFRRGLHKVLTAS